MATTIRDSSTKGEDNIKLSDNTVNSSKPKYTDEGELEKPTVLELVDCAAALSCWSYSKFNTDLTPPQEKSVNGCNQIANETKTQSSRNKNKKKLIPKIVIPIIIAIVAAVTASIILGLHFKNGSSATVPDSSTAISDNSKTASDEFTPDSTSSESSLEYTHPKPKLTDSALDQPEGIELPVWNAMNEFAEIYDGDSLTFAADMLAQRSTIEAILIEDMSENDDKAFLVPVTGVLSKEDIEAARVSAKKAIRILTEAHLKSAEEDDEKSTITKNSTTLISDVDEICDRYGSDRRLILLERVRRACLNYYGFRNNRQDMAANLSQSVFDGANEVITERLNARCTSLGYVHDVEFELIYPYKSNLTQKKVRRIQSKLSEIYNGYLQGGTLSDGDDVLLTNQRELLDSAVFFDQIFCPANLPSNVKALGKKNPLERLAVREDRFTPAWKGLVESMAKFIDDVRYLGDGKYTLSVVSNETNSA